jgi:hypothetical protein
VRVITWIRLPGSSYQIDGGDTARSPTITRYQLSPRCVYFIIVKLFYKCSLSILKLLNLLCKLRWLRRFTRSRHRSVDRVRCLIFYVPPLLRHFVPFYIPILYTRSFERIVYYYITPSSFLFRIIRI